MPHVRVTREGVMCIHRAVNGGLAGVGEPTRPNCANARCRGALPARFRRRSPEKVYRCPGRVGAPAKAARAFSALASSSSGDKPGRDIDNEPMGAMIRPN